MKKDHLSIIFLAGAYIKNKEKQNENNDTSFKIYLIEYFLNFNLIKI